MKTVIEMAREDGLPLGERGAVPLWDKELKRFAELVRADTIAEEREACAKVCADLHIDGDDDTGLAADLIRARGNTC